MRKYTLILAIFLSASAAIGQEKKASEDKRSTPDLPGVILLDFGFNFYKSAPSELDINWFKSKSFGLYYMRAFPIGKKITFNPALGISFEKYGFSNDVSIGYVDDGSGEVLSVVDLSGIDQVKKSQLAMNYFEIPVQFRYYFKGNDVKGAAYLALGGMASLLVESHTKVKFKDGGRDQTSKSRDDFQQSNLRYGVQGRFGFGSVNFFYKQYFSKLFNSNGPTGATNISTSTIGISISGL